MPLKSCTASVDLLPALVRLACVGLLSFGSETRTQYGIHNGRLRPQASCHRRPWSQVWLQGGKSCRSIYLHPVCVRCSFASLCEVCLSLETLCIRPCTGTPAGGPGASALHGFRHESARWKSPWADRVEMDTITQPNQMYMKLYMHVPKNMNQLLCMITLVVSSMMKWNRMSNDHRLQHGLVEQRLAVSAAFRAPPRWGTDCRRPDRLRPGGIRRRKRHLANWMRPQPQVCVSVRVASPK